MFWPPLACGLVQAVPMDTSPSLADLVGTEEWPQAHRLGRPYVVYKFAATLDGRIAAQDGTSQWITSAESRAEVHLLRAGCDATLVGAGTQQADNPSLNVRHRDPRIPAERYAPDGQPLRVVLDSRARTPAAAKVLDESAPTLIVVSENADARHLPQHKLLRLPAGPRGLHLDALLSELYRRGIRGVFLEGGPTLAGAFMAAKRIDRVVTYIAPALLGAGKAGLEDAGIQTMADIQRLQILHCGRCGVDLRVIARPSY